MKKRKSNRNKTIAIVLACVLLIGGVVGGTVAWLTAQTSEVKNVFTPSNIGVELKEHTYDATNDTLTQDETTTGVSNYKMIPGWTIPKDPWATVTSGSEDCYLFIKVEEVGGTAGYPFSSFIKYAVNTTGDNPWIALNGYTGVYYKEIDTAEEKGVAHYILGGSSDSTKIVFGGNTYTWNDNEVLTKPDVTKEMMDALQAEGVTYPTLKFTAYAHQLYSSKDTKFEVTTAWSNLTANQAAGN